MRAVLYFCTRVAMVCWLVNLEVTRAAAKPTEDFEQFVKPLMAKKCFECHSADKKKGELDLEAFKDYGSVTNALETWKAVLERVQAFEMPPKKAGELKFDDQRKFVEFLRALPKPPAPNCDELASDRTANFYRGYVMSRRLNRSEYVHTIRDLLGVRLESEDGLPADGGGGEGFDTTGNALFLSPIHMEQYMRAAEKALNAVLPDSVLGLSAELRAARKRILGRGSKQGQSPAESARAILHEFARKAWRRPVPAGEMTGIFGLYERGRSRGDGHVPSLRLALRAVLISPHFLFLAEPEPLQGGVQPLAAVPLASKLSYFLWSSMPDDQLSEMAESGRLLNTNVLRSEIRRMLADPKADALGERFALQWLDLEGLGTEVRPDPQTFPEFDGELASAMRGEVVRFFNDLLRNDRSLIELIDSRHTFVNARLARLYGVAVPRGGTWQRVSLASRDRGGLVGMAAVHAMNSYPLRTSPVLRGRWVLESLLGEKVPPPPEGTPTLEEEKVAASPLTLRQQLETHRSKPECAACHDKMDPLGFGMENFDVLGRWRTSDKGQPIDTKGTLPSGKSFEGPSGLKDVLMERKEALLKHLARKMTGFALGRELNKYDDCVVDRAMQAMQDREYRAWALVESIAMSFPFRHRFYPKQEN